MAPSCAHLARPCPDSTPADAAPHGRMAVTTMDSRLDKLVPVIKTAYLGMFTSKVVYSDVSTAHGAVPLGSEYAGIAGAQRKMDSALPDALRRFPAAEWFIWSDDDVFWAREATQAFVGRILELNSSDVALLGGGGIYFATYFMVTGWSTILSRGAMEFLTTPGVIEGCVEAMQPGTESLPRFRLGSLTPFEGSKRDSVSRRCTINNDHIISGCVGYRGRILPIPFTFGQNDHRNDVGTYVSALFSEVPSAGKGVPADTNDQDNVPAWSRYFAVVAGTHHITIDEIAHLAAMQEANPREARELVCERVKPLTIAYLKWSWGGDDLRGAKPVFECRVGG